MSKAHSPLLGFNTNVRHKGKVFHIQTEDSGIKHPHVITHLFADGGRILKSTKTSYGAHLGDDELTEKVRALMKDQHKAMFIALRDGEFDSLIDDAFGGSTEAKPSQAASPPQAVSAPTETASAADPPQVADVAPPPPAAQPAAPAQPAALSAQPQAPQPQPPPPPTPVQPAPPAPAAAPPQRAVAIKQAPKSEVDDRAPTLRKVPVPRPGAPRPGPPPPPAAAAADKPARPSREVDVDIELLERAAAEQQSQSPLFHPPADMPPPPPTLLSPKRFTGSYRGVTPAPPTAQAAPPQSGGRYAASRPASVFASARPSEGGTVFGEDMISDKSLDEVILSFLSDEFDGKPGGSNDDK